MLKWFRKDKVTVHPDAKYNSCECGVRFYLKAVNSGKMALTEEGFYEAINARMNPELNKYFCHCQPERSKREDLPDNWDCRPCLDLFIDESKGKILDYRYRRMRCSEHCGNTVSPK